MKTLMLSIAFLLLLGFVACNNSNERDKIRTDQQQAISIGKLAGQVYFVAPELDSLSGDAKGHCDCCAGHLLFVNDSQFIAVDYCINGDTYYKGTYRTNDTAVFFTCDSLRISTETNWEAEVDTAQKNLPAYFVMESNEPIATFSWKAFMFRNKLCFAVSYGDYATREQKEEQDFIHATKTDSVWLRLKIKN